MTLKTFPIWSRYRGCTAAPLAEMPRPDTWLTQSEQLAWSAMRSEVRQLQWLVGRYVAKQLVSQALEVDALQRIEIVTRNELRLGMAPQVYVDGQRSYVSLSLSHVENGVLAALTLDPELALGVDLACEIPYDVRFRSLWFTAAENQWLDEAPRERTSLLWGLKEAVFKAACSCQNGTSLAWRPTQIELTPRPDRRFDAALDGKSLGVIDPLVQSVAGGLSIVVCLSRLNMPRLKSPVTTRRNELPTLNTLTPAMATDAIGMGMTAIS